VFIPILKPLHFASKIHIVFMKKSPFYSEIFSKFLDFCRLQQMLVTFNGATSVAVFLSYCMFP